jgi:hypothetical protein
MGTRGKEKAMYTTQREVRNAFWLTNFVEGKPRKYYGKSQNDLPVDVRMAFVDFVDYLEREGTISESLASRVTL